MTASRLQNLLDDLQQDRALREPQQLARRLHALEQLEHLLFHDVDAPTLRWRGEALAAELEAINQRLYQDARDDIRRGNGADTLTAWAASLRATDEDEGYDALDTLVSGVLDLQEPAAIAPLDAEMVFYQPTPARYIFDFIAGAQIGERDVVMDLGAGLGHVALLTAICTRAPCIGVELQPAYVASARACAQALHLRHARFIEQDVRAADMSMGTVFYLYTPFTGSILRAVLDLLRREAQHRAIRLCTLGPCTTIVAQEPWLEARQAGDGRRPALFRSI